ncbi:photosystem I reaction center subunit XII [Prochlorococcus sp. MIT 0602]|nr:photosystem I subunit XII (PsaM) [Prochlorococcus sp. MIT 0602]KGG17107.1 photosystem I subunit XII (PsaM) [Prochlorococcus sp. MIT 0603]
MFSMETSTTIDLAGLCLVVVMHAGILALRLGISLRKA